MGAIGRPEATVRTRESTRSLPDAPASLPAPLSRVMAFVPARTMEFIVLEQGFEGARLNTGTMSDLQTLVRHLLANFRTIRLPAEALPARPNLQPSDWWAMAKARLAEKRVLYNLRDGIRRVLNAASPWVHRSSGT